MQQHSAAYGQLEEGNQLSFAAASEHLKQTGVDLDFGKLMRGPIQDIIVMTLKSVESGNKLNPHGKKHCFEIFGYDFMVD